MTTDTTTDTVTDTTTATEIKEDTLRR
jgi:hypothetical protein